MSRPQTIDELNTVYEEMTRRQMAATSWTFDTQIALEDTRVCKAIFTYGSWNLCPHTWSRLQAWLKPLREYGIPYAVNPSKLSGKLHFTFHQLSGFSTNLELEQLDEEKFKDFMSQISGIKIEFRGLLVTPTGIALRGFPADENQLRKFMNLRNSLTDFCKENGIQYTPPYMNDIIHSTLIRWTKPLSSDLIQYIKMNLIRWDECWFGSCLPTRWYYGLGTLLMIPPHVVEKICIHTPIQVAHRGLVNGPNRTIENNIDTILHRSENGLYSEIDVWLINGNWFIGHDSPSAEFPVDILFKYGTYLWIHAKNKDAFEALVLFRKEGRDLCIFWHTTEDYCFTTNMDVIVYPGKKLVKNCVFMMPENACGIDTNNNVDYICSDYSA